MVSSFWAISSGWTLSCVTSELLVIFIICCFLCCNANLVCVHALLPRQKNLFLRFRICIRDHWSYSHLFLQLVLAELLYNHVNPFLSSLICRFVCFYFGLSFTFLWAREACNSVAMFVIVLLLVNRTVSSATPIRIKFHVSHQHGFFVCLGLFQVVLHIYRFRTLQGWLQTRQSNTHTWAKYWASIFGFNERSVFATWPVRR